MSVALVAIHAGDRGKRIAHPVDAELGPAHAPKVVRGRAAVDAFHDARELSQPRGDAAVHLTQFQRLHGGVARHGALDDARLDQVDGKVVADDAADRAVPSDHRRDALLVDAVLGGDHVAIGSEIGRDHRRGPGRVVGLHGNDGDVDGRVLREALDLRDVHRPDAGLETLGGDHADDAQALRSHRLHMLRPAVDGDDIVRGCSEMRGDVAADGAGADDCDALTILIIPPR